MGIDVIYIPLFISAFACILSWAGFPESVYKSKNIDLVYLGITVTMVGIYSISIREHQRQGNIKWEAVFLMIIVIGTAIPVIL